MQLSGQTFGDHKWVNKIEPISFDVSMNEFLRLAYAVRVGSACASSGPLTETLHLALMKKTRNPIYTAIFEIKRSTNIIIQC